MDLAQFFKDYGYIIAVVIVPIGLWIGSILYQNRQVRKKAKLDLFLSLMANRKSIPITQEWVDSLNQIDAIFQDNERVRKAWEKYFESLHNNSPKANETSTYKIELLSEIAQDLGYKNLKPSDLANFYSPQQFNDTLQRQIEIENELLRVLKASKSYSSNL